MMNTHTEGEKQDLLNRLIEWRNKGEMAAILIASFFESALFGILVKLQEEASKSDERFFAITDKELFEIIRESTIQSLSKINEIVKDKPDGFLSSKYKPGTA